jgi:murein DD-endopeptidase MepM/ murein hydrolase activator NlpD
MKCKPNWQKIFWKVLTYTLIAVLASASTFAVLGERSTTLNELGNIIQIKFDAQTSLEKTKEELENQKLALEASKKELEASKEELEASRANLEKVLAQLDAALTQTEELKNLLLSTNEETQTLLEEAQRRESEMADMIEQLQTALKDLEEKQKNVWVVPVQYEYVSSRYDYRWHPIDNTYTFHYGVDLAAREGMPVVASRGGRIETVGYEKDGAGNYIIINHGDGYKSKYLHLQKSNVTVGHVVITGQVIGTCGSTGASTGPHLDFRIVYNGNYVDPEKYIDIG